MTGSRLAHSGSHCSFPAHQSAPGEGLPPTRTTGGPISTELRINERIRVPEVRLVGPNGETVGIVPTDQALKLAQEADLDLVEIAPQGRPPVCKLMDYGKFKYENAQKARESRRNQTNVIIKEMKLRPKIDQHDYETKKGHVVRFLGCRRQGQDHDHVPRSRAAPPRAGLPPAADAWPRTSQELGFVESSPKQDGRNMIMVLGPHKKKADAKIDADAARAAKEQARADRRGRGGRRARGRSPAGPVAQKKERGRSENLDPEIEA